MIVNFGGDTILFPATLSISELYANFLAQKLLGKPKISHIHLEEFGNFIWKEIDGSQTLMDISKKVHEKFKEKAEPLLPRLVQYFKILENNSFIQRKK